MIKFLTVPTLITLLLVVNSAAVARGMGASSFAPGTTPHLASGASIAIEDSIVLARLLQSKRSLDAILEDFIGSAMTDVA
jgi:hypothetical protein